ncbi:MAG: tetratricopeptide repeat protein [Candidatus Hermodarchaeota archaeon]
MKPKDLKDLYEKGKYSEVLVQLLQMENQGTFSFLSDDEQIECLYYKCRSLERSGQFKEAFQLSTTARRKFSSPHDKTLSLALLIAQLYALWRLGRIEEALELSMEGDTIIEVLTVNERNAGASWMALFENIKGILYGHKGELDTALDYYQRSLALREMIGNPQDIAGSLNNIAIIYSSKGDLDTALDYYQRSLALHKTIGNSQDIAGSLLNIGLIYRSKGELDTALDYLHQSLALKKTSGNLQEIAGSLLNIGLIYSSKGDLDTALDYLHQSLGLHKTIGNPQDIALSLEAIGEIFHSKGELDTALDYLQRSLGLREAIGNDIETSLHLFSLILLVLDQQDQSQAQTYLNQLQKLYARTPNKWIHLRSRLAEALVLKRSTRMKNKVQAQIILEQIINEELIHFRYTALAMIHLCELLILELKSFDEPEVWEEAKTLILQLYDKAQDQQSVSIVGEALLLRAKFATIEGNLQQALEYFDQAQLTAEERNLGLLIQKVGAERKTFEDEFEKWQDLIQSNAPLQERLKHAEMGKYLRDVKKMVELMSRSAEE